MRVALTQHLDRSPEKLLLKGRVGRIHSWVWKESDRLPEVVYVKFDNSEHWTLDGVTEAGVYPIYPATEQWYLDPKRKRSVLKIRRTQLPLTPAYAITAHASQGKTLAAVLLDLTVDKRVDATFGTVAASRVRHREDVLILRPFPRWLFNRGESEGPSLLLQQLRGEEIDWAAYRDARYPMAACEKCRQLRCFDSFESKQWDKIRANRPATCLRCVHTDCDGTIKRKAPSGSIKFLCHSCKTQKVEDAFPRAQLSLEGDNRQCLSCAQQLRSLECAVCCATKPTEDFSSTMVTMPAANIMCKDCQADAKAVSAGTQSWQGRGWFTCRGCDIMYAIVPEDSGGKQKRYCANCSSRGARQKDEHTCRNSQCGRKWREPQPRGVKRKRYCPDCRK